MHTYIPRQLRQAAHRHTGSSELSWGTANLHIGIPELSWGIAKLQGKAMLQLRTKLGHYRFERKIDAPA